jgi:hypothetical protein
MLAGVGYRHFDELRRQGFVLLAVGDRGGERGGILRGDPLTGVGTLTPDLMLEVGAGLAPGGLLTVFGLEAALFHGFQGGHLLEDCRTLRREDWIHGRHAV